MLLYRNGTTHFLLLLYFNELKKACIKTVLKTFLVSIKQSARFLSRHFNMHVVLIRARLQFNVISSQKRRMCGINNTKAIIDAVRLQKLQLATALKIEERFVAYFKFLNINENIVHCKIIYLFTLKTVQL